MVWCPKNKSASHCPTELFPIYPNNHWTIRRWDDHIVVSSSNRIKLKIDWFIVISANQPISAKKGWDGCACFFRSTLKRTPNFNSGFIISTTYQKNVIFLAARVTAVPQTQPHFAPRQNTLACLWIAMLDRWYYIILTHMATHWWCCAYQ